MSSDYERLKRSDLREPAMVRDGPRPTGLHLLFPSPVESMQITKSADHRGPSGPDTATGDTMAGFGALQRFKLQVAVDRRQRKREGSSGPASEVRKVEVWNKPRSRRSASGAGRR
jgi:hypothetical protein